MLKNRKGVTFIEIMLTVSIVLILSIISFKIYGYQTEKATAVSGVNLMRKIADTEKVYYMEHKEWCLSFADLPMELDGEFKEGADNTIKTKDFIFSLTTAGSNGKDLSINAVRNYFDKFEIEENKEDGYSMSWIVSRDDTKSYKFTARSYNVYATLEKTVVNYLKKRFGA